MKPSHQGILISLFIHLGLFLAFVFIRVAAQTTVRDAVVQIELLPPKPVAQQGVPDRIVPKVPGAIASPQATPMPPGLALLQPLTADSSDDVINAYTPSASADTASSLQLVYSELLIKKNMLPLSHKNTAKDQTTLLKPIPKDFFLPQGNYYDHLDRDLHHRNRGGLDNKFYLSDLANALNSLKKDKKPDFNPRLNFIPSETELEAFRVLWEKQEATDQEMYGKLDTSIKITAVDFNRTLSELVHRGVLTREIVSPRDEFTIQGFGNSIAIEKNTLNRLNRIYRYKPLVDQEHMMRYLEAVLYQMEQKSDSLGNAHSDNARMVEKLRQKIIKMAKPSG